MRGGGLFMSQKNSKSFRDMTHHSQARIPTPLVAANGRLADWEVGRNGPPRLPDAYIVFV